MAASILKCGENWIWLDNTDLTKIKEANSRHHIRSMVSSGIIRKKNVEVHSRHRANIRREER